MSLAMIATTHRRMRTHVGLARAPLVLEPRHVSADGAVHACCGGEGIGTAGQVDGCQYKQACTGGFVHGGGRWSARGRAIDLQDRNLAVVVLTCTLSLAGGRPCERCERHVSSLLGNATFSRKLAYAVGAWWCADDDSESPFAARSRYSSTRVHT